MRLHRAPDPTTMLVVAGCLVALQGWTAPLGAQSKRSLAQSKGSCEAVASRQATAYMARLQAKQYSAARDLARKTADACLEAGDLERARTWFQTARTVEPTRSRNTADDVKWQQRYEKAVARLGGPPLHLADTAKRAALSPNPAPPRVRRPVATNAAAPSEGTAVAAERSFDWQGLSWIGAGVFGVLAMGATALLRRRARPLA